jgi:3-deoxy-7-phosphoheptulonate synthase
MKIAGRISIEDLPRIAPLLCRTAGGEWPADYVRSVRVGGVQIGNARPVIMAGPCTVESFEQTLDLARAARASGADMLRGGAYKPRTSPHDFQGLGFEGLKILKAVREETGLPIVTEVIDVRLVETVAAFADVIQIGSRSMQNYPLLSEVGRMHKPVLLKRGMAASLCEWLGAAEYIAMEGNLEIILCERGIRGPCAGEYSRFSLDLSTVPAVRQNTFLPVIVDPSHSTGVSAMVEPASRAAMEFGADGLIIEIASDREDATRPKCDADQAITPITLRRIVEFARERHERVTSVISPESAARELARS